MLFLRELKKVVFSISFFVLIAGTIAMVASQGVLDMSGQEKLEMPQPGQDYGTQAKEIPEVIMPAAIQVLYGEFCTNSYTAYPIGFYKNVRLSYDKRQQMAEIISALTGTPADELMQAAGESTQDGNSYTFDDSEIDVQGNGGYTITTQDSMSSDDETGFSIALTDDISYEEFLSYMKKADKLIGGGSFYSDTYLANSFGQTAITYEEAVDSYNLIKDSDHFTGAYARLFCDYMLIVLSVLPVFIAVALCLKDKQTSMNGLIYSRTASSARIILTRYLAIITAVMVPAVILFYISSASIWGMYNGMKLDYLIPLKYCFGCADMQVFRIHKAHFGNDCNCHVFGLAWNDNSGSLKQHGSILYGSHGVLCA